MIGKKIYSAVDATVELVGTWGYFSDVIGTLKRKDARKEESDLRELTAVFDENTLHRFQPDGKAFESFILYMPVCSAGNKEAYVAWAQGKKVSKMRSNIKCTYVHAGGVEPDFLNETGFEIIDEPEEKERHYVPFDTINEFIEASGVTNKNCPGHGSRPFIWVRNLKAGHEVLVSGYDTKENEVRISLSWYDMESLLEVFTFLDGAPCGKEADE